MFSQQQKKNASGGGSSSPDSNPFLHLPNARFWPGTLPLCLFTFTLRCQGKRVAQVRQPDLVNGHVDGDDLGIGRPADAVDGLAVEVPDGLPLLFLVLLLPLRLQAPLVVDVVVAADKVNVARIVLQAHVGGAAPGGRLAAAVGAVAVVGEGAVLVAVPAVALLALRVDGADDPGGLEDDAVVGRAGAARVDGALAVVAGAGEAVLTLAVVDELQDDAALVEPR